MKKLLTTAAMIAALSAPATAGGFFGGGDRNTNNNNNTAIAGAAASASSKSSASARAHQHQGQAQGQVQGQVANGGDGSSRTSVAVNTQRSAPSVSGGGVGGGGDCQNAISIGNSYLNGAAVVGGRWTPGWCKHLQIGNYLGQYAGDKAAIVHVYKNIPTARRSLEAAGVVKSTVTRTSTRGLARNEPVGTNPVRGGGKDR